MVQSNAHLPKWESGKSTFIHNMRLPVHGWFRFPAGFSAEWAESVIESRKETLEGRAFFDPFAGVGTSVLAAERAGVRAFGVEAQPFIQRIAEAKALWHTSTEHFYNMAQAVADRAMAEHCQQPSYPALIKKCFTEEAIRDLDGLRCAWEQLNDGSSASKLTWLALVSILRACSFAGTAPWQYVLPAKTKAKVLAPYEAFTLQVRRMLSDMNLWQTLEVRHESSILLDDARSCNSIPDGSVGLVVTSPPYANNYDYADATRLEMTFLGEVHGWGQLHEVARKNLIRSSSQHASIEKLNLNRVLETLGESTFAEEIAIACQTLAEDRLNHGGKKDYHLMIAAYFSDMKEVWRTLRRVCADGSEVCFVVGDSAPYGGHVPTERWLGELAVQAGFQSYTFEKIRDRNVKWKNRKHRIPLHEGFLWVHGKQWLVHRHIDLARLLVICWKLQFFPFFTSSAFSTSYTLTARGRGRPAKDSNAHGSTSMGISTIWTSYGSEEALPPIRARL